MWIRGVEVRSELYNQYMFKYFDKTFFKFVLGFAGMLSLGFIVLMAIGYYEVEMQGVNASMQAGAGQ
jgi:ABC-type branched-subunit amino acid transport system permease subunit